jgi:hypothetical protein
MNSKTIRRLPKEGVISRSTISTNFKMTFRVHSSTQRRAISRVDQALDNLVNHHYDIDHENCGDWCKKTPSYVITALFREGLAGTGNFELESRLECNSTHLQSIEHQNNS